MQRPCLKVVRRRVDAVGLSNVFKETRPSAEQMSHMWEGPTGRPVRSLRGVQRVPISKYRQKMTPSRLAFRRNLDLRLPMAEVGLRTGRAIAGRSRGAGVACETAPLPWLPNVGRFPARNPPTWPLGLTWLPSSEEGEGTATQAQPGGPVASSDS